MTREEVIKYIKETYHRDPEYLWEKFPNYAIFRAVTEHWFVILMDVEKNKLSGASPKDTAKVNIMNVKCEPEIIASLREHPNIFPAYHMSKDYWVSVVLDNNIDEKLVIDLIDQSYTLVD